MSDDHRSKLERLLCNPLPIGSIEDLVPRVEDAWSVRFTDLRALPAQAKPARKLKFCIATEDIVGPVRNGGIGTTYAALSELIAKLGHDITILYLKGRDVESHDIDHWIRFYAEKGVRFVPAPNYAEADDFRTNADRWLHAPYNMLRYLLENPMDVVHVSEWRGSGYLSLLAKRQGLAFAKTLFVVKTSSPWMWNRLYGSQTLERLDDLAKVHAERQSVELADVVIGGSLHLLRWMSSQGYKLPRARTFVQPNVAVFDHLAGLLAKRSLTRGDRTPIDEIVFFGRLEARKGLFVFCQAIKRLIRLGVPLPPRITFMGKQGARLTARPNQSILEFIESESRDWPTQVQVLTEFQQYEALDYLLDGARLAVMPSVIENSSMAIYEAAICGIPCVASNVGGNAELVAEADWPHLLCDPHPLPLADILAEALTLGGFVPRPSFDNDANLATWRWFHQNLAEGLHEHLIVESAPQRAAAVAGSATVCVYYTGRDEALRATLLSLGQQDAAAAEVLVAVDADDVDATERAREIAGEFDLPLRIFEAFDFDAGAAFNQLANEATSDYLLFLWEGATLAPHALRALSTVAASSGAEVLNYFYRVIGDDAGRAGAGYLKALVVGSVSDAFFRNDITELPIYVRRETFRALDGFTTDYRVLCHDHEFLAKAQLAGRRCETALLELGAVLAWDARWLSAKCYDTAISQFRAIRPQLAAAPLGLRDLLLSSKGLQARGGGGGKRKGEAEGAVDGPLARMMQSILVDGPKPKAAKAAAPEPASPPPQPAPVGTLGMLQLIEGEQARSQGRKSGRGAAANKATTAAAQAPASRPQPPAFTTGALTSEQGGLRGQLLTLYQDQIYGWACDRDHPERVLELDFTLAGQTRRLRADADLPLLMEAPEPVRGHGFVIPIPPGSKMPWRREERRPMSLRIAGSNLWLAQDIAAPPARNRFQDGDLQGYCDPSDTGTINGWVWRPSAPETTIDVAIFVDDLFLTRVRADRYREDLRHHGVGNGEYGFWVPLPAKVRQGGSHRVDVVVTATGAPLPRSPLIVHGVSVRPLPKGPRGKS